MAQHCNGGAPGPIVLRHKGTSAYTALSGRSANLKRIAVRDGWALVRHVPGRAVDRAWAANLRAESALYVLERNGN